MDLLTGDQIAALAHTEADETHVSLFLPTHRFGRGVDADRLQWKNLVSDVEDRLRATMRRPEVDALLAPAWRLHEDAIAWQYMSDGLVMFLRTDWDRTFRVAAPMVTLATIGPRFVMGPLLRLLAGDERFFLLALSQREVRLMEGSRHTVEQVELDEVPTSLTDVVRPREPRSDTMARPVASAGRGGPAVFYGHGAADRHTKSDEVTRFLRAVATGVSQLLAGQSAPMVLVGLDHLVAAYREVNAYGNLVDEAVVRNADGMTAEDLHGLAWPVVEERLRAGRARVFDRFSERHGTGVVSSDLTTVARAAAEGRVETLFVRADPWCWEQIAGDRAPVVQLGADEGYGTCEQVDVAAVDTLRAGGQVYATAQTAVPGSDVAAIFRY